MKKLSFLLVACFYLMSLSAQNYDPRITATEAWEYSLTPLDHIDSISFNGFVHNNGLLILTNVQLRTDVYRGASRVYSDSNSVVLLPSGFSSQIFMSNKYLPDSVGTYYAVFTCSAAEGDQDTSNSIDSITFEITDTIFARDPDSFPTGLSNAPDTTSVLGQTFTLLRRSTLSSVSFYLFGPTMGDPASISIWTFSGGFPGAKIGQSTVMTIPSATGAWYTLSVTNLNGGPLKMNAGTYVIGIDDKTATGIAIGSSPLNYVQGSIWLHAGISWFPIDLAFGIFVSMGLRGNFIVEDYDARIDAIVSSEYTQIPLDQVTPFNFQVQIENSGRLTLTNVELDVDIYRDGVHQFHDSVQIASLAPETQQLVSTPTMYTPNAIGAHNAVFTVSSSEPEAEPSDNIDSVLINITDSVYARDDGDMITSLSVGIGTAGILGQNFEVTVLDTLTSVSFHLTAPLSGTNVTASIYTFVDSPITELTRSDILTTTTADTGGAWFTVPILDSLGGPLILSPDIYFVGLNEDAATQLTLTMGRNIFTAGAGWIFFNNNWSNSEDFGFFLPYLVRANFGPSPPDTTSVLTLQIAEQMNLYPNPNSGQFTVTLNMLEQEDVSIGVYDVAGSLLQQRKIANATRSKLNFDLSDQPAGVYFVKLSTGKYELVKKVVLE